MKSSPLVRLTVGPVPQGGALAWAEGLSFQLPEALIADAGLSRLLDEHNVLTVDPQMPPLALDAVDAVRLRRAYTEQRPASSRLPIPYQSIPPALRSWIASLIGKSKRRSVDRWAAFPAWPLDLSADLVADLAACWSPFRDGPTPVLLSHDIDSGEGLVNAHGMFIDIEESVGARSSNYIVPCAWPLDHGLLRDLKARGHEIGIHGYDHNNQTPFADDEERLARLKAPYDVIREYGIIGYRAPSLLRTEPLIRDLASFYQYDSSIPSSGGLFPVPNNGCASARPFRLHGIVEIPLSMPRDGSLRFLGYAPEEILQIWKTSATMIARSGGVVVLLTHCEERFSGNPAMLATYRCFLEWISETDTFEWATPLAVMNRFIAHESQQTIAAAPTPEQERQWTS
jgi:peptidoglycan/xylan/chitin deacetylase (PgdA/CDA1 family)